MYQIIKPKKYT